MLFIKTIYMLFNFMLDLIICCLIKLLGYIGFLTKKHIFLPDNLENINEFYKLLFVKIISMHYVFINSFTTCGFLILNRLRVGFFYWDYNRFFSLRGVHKHKYLFSLLQALSQTYFNQRLFRLKIKNFTTEIVCVPPEVPKL